MAYRILKRILDVVFSLSLLILSIPFLIIISLILLIQLKQNPFLTQKRGVTLDKKIFKLYKLKTLNLSNYTTPQPVSNNILYKHHYRPYVSKFCRWLRKSGIDEFPQLINVLKGEMSLIGPRPLMLPDLKSLKDNFPVYYLERNKITVKPGITGLWQVYGKRREGLNNLVDLDKTYQEKISLKLDLNILIKTIWIAITANNSDAVLNGEIRKSFKIKEIKEIKESA